MSDSGYVLEIDELQARIKDLEQELEKWKRCHICSKSVEYRNVTCDDCESDMHS